LHQAESLLYVAQEFQSISKGKNNYVFYDVRIPVFYDLMEFAVLPWMLTPAPLWARAV
jgi:hypothetical protein